MLFSYISIIKTVKSTNAMSADGFLTDHQRKVERDVTRVGSYWIVQFDSLKLCSIKPPITFMLTWLFPRVPLKISIVICTAFIMAWSPYAVISMWSAWGFHVPSTTSILTRLFAKSASFYNPLIYFGMSSKFRKDVSVLLPCTHEHREVVRLKNIKPKAEALPLPASLPIKKQEEKYTMVELNQPNHDSDSGVNSPPETPPSDTQGIFYTDPPSHVETSEYWSDRLWGSHINTWNAKIESIFVLFPLTY